MPPVYFMTALWGARYRAYFIGRCLPSLLHRDNDGMLLRPGNKFLLATTDEDLAALRHWSIFRYLSEFMEVAPVDLAPQPADKSGCEHVRTVWPRMAQVAFEAGAIGVPVIPDAMLSAGALSSAWRAIDAGAKVVMMPGVRCEEEGLLNRVSGAVPSRGLVLAALAHFHSETARYEWRSRCFSDAPGAAWWGLGDYAALMHTTGWLPLMIDYRRLARHDVTCLETSNLDGSYVYDNFGAELDGMHLVTDSDEACWVGFSPAADRAQSLEPVPWRWLAPVKGALLRRYLAGPDFDPLRRRLFMVPVRWHGGDVPEATWRRAERRARWTLRWALRGWSLTAMIWAWERLAPVWPAARAAWWRFYWAAVPVVARLRYKARIRTRLKQLVGMR